MLLDHRGYKNGFVKVDGVRIHYVQVGSDEFPVIVLLHGLQDCGGSWYRISDTLSSEYCVIALDYRGHGESGREIQGRYSFDGFVSDVEALVEQLHLGAFTLIGHGLGGAVGAAFSSIHPESVEALVVVDADLSVSNYKFRLVSDDFGESRREFISLEDVLCYLRALQPGSTEDSLLQQASYITRALVDGRFVWKCDPMVLGEYVHDGMFLKWAGLQCPKLIVRGRQSAELTHENAVKMSEASSRVRLVELEGGGHWVHQELPDAFEGTMRWFFQNLPR